MESIATITFSYKVKITAIGDYKEDIEKKLKSYDNVEVKNAYKKGA